MPAREAFATDFQFLSATNEFYARAFMTVHFFQSSKEYQERLNRYLNILQIGDSPESALNKAFGWSFDDLDRELVRYSRGNLYARAFEQDQLIKLINQANPNLRANIKLTEIKPQAAMRAYAQFIDEMRLSSVPDAQKRAFLDQVRANQALQEQKQ